MDAGSYPEKEGGCFDSICRKKKVAPSRVTSYSSSLTDDRGKLDAFIKTGSSHRCFQMVKMLSVILIPVVTLLVLAAVALGRAVQTQYIMSVARAAIEKNIEYAGLIEKLQQERDYTSFFWGTDISDITTALQSVYNRQQAVDLAIYYLKLWDPDLVISGKTYETKELIRLELQRFRNQIERDPSLLHEDSMIYYNKIVADLNNFATVVTPLPANANLWLLLVANDVTLRAADSAGQQMSYGATSFITCGLSDSMKSSYVSVDTTDQIMYNIVRVYYESATYFDEEYRKINKTLQTLKDKILSDQYAIICQEFERMEKFHEAELWIGNMTDYINIFSHVREKIGYEIQDKLSHVVAGIEQDLILYSTLMSVVIVACFVTSMWYASCIDTMTRDIGTFAKRVSFKTQELTAEKRRTDNLLYQMMPKKVADQLKKKEVVKAEYFDMATIFFSDIVGFTLISAKSNPLQVVDLLNGLYR